MKYIKNDLPKMSIKGNDYVKVHERILFFRENYPEFSILTEILNIINSSVVIKASILDEKREIRFTGLACGSFGNEKELEKTESVAVGRALANAGIGIIDGIASADEMANYYNKAENNNTQDKSTQRTNTNTQSSKKQYNKVNNDEQWYQIEEKKKGFLYKNKDTLKKEYLIRYDIHKLGNKKWYVSESQKDRLLGDYIDSISVLDADTKNDTQAVTSNTERTDLTPIFIELSDVIADSKELAQKCKDLYEDQSEMGKTFRKQIIGFTGKDLKTVTEKDLNEMINMIKIGEDEIINNINSLVAF
jgi:hypothetical protein